MSKIANRSLALFEEYKDHPVVKALIMFLDVQRRPLQDVAVWSCEIEKISSNEYSQLFKSYEFDVLFTAQDGFRGTIITLADNTCVVHTYRLYVIHSE